MTNANSGDDPTDPTGVKPSDESPRLVPKEDIGKELAREFRWVEIAQIGSNVVLAVVGVIALCIYSGQLDEMRKSSKAAKDAADAAKQSAETSEHYFQMERRRAEDTEEAVCRFQ